MSKLKKEITCFGGCRSYSVSYKLKLTPDFNLHVINESGAMKPVGFLIELDSAYKIKYIPNFKFETSVFYRLKHTQLVKKNNARSIASNHFSISFKNSPFFSELLIYNAKTDIFLWEFKKVKGFKKVTEEKVIINAENAEFVSKEVSTYKKFR